MSAPRAVWLVLPLLLQFDVRGAPLQRGLSTCAELVMKESAVWKEGGSTDADAEKFTYRVHVAHWVAFMHVTITWTREVFVDAIYDAGLISGGRAPHSRPFLCWW